MTPGGTTRGGARAPAKAAQRGSSAARPIATVPTPDSEIFRTLFNSAGTGLVHLDLRGRILQSNPAYRRLVGHSEEELRTLTIQDLTHEEDRPRSAELFKRLVKGDVPTFETVQRYVRKDGASVWVHNSVSLSRDAEGRPLYAHAISQDISERKRAEEQALRQGELYEALAAVHNSLGDGLAVEDAEAGRLLLVNDAFCRIYGYTREELLALPDPLALCAPEERATMGERLRRRRERSTTFERYDVVGVRRDGSRVALEVAARLAPASPLVVTIARDVTDRRRSDRARAQFAAIVDSADLAIVGVSLEGMITGWNAAAARVFGSSADEMIGQPVTALAPNDADQVRRAFQSALRGESVHYESEAFRKDGTRFPAALSISPIRDATNVVIGVSGIVRDESNRRRSEEALHDALSLYSATLEATADGVLVVDLQRTIRSFNRRFVDIWGVPASLLSQRDEEKCMRFRADQTKDPEGVLKRLSDIYAAPDKESIDLVELRDGRILERLSQPQRIGDRVVGRVWSYRDVTEKIWGERSVELTRELALRLTEAKGLSEALEIVLERVAKGTGWSLGQAWVANADGKTLECNRARYVARKELAAFHDHSLGVKFRPGQGLPGRVWASGKPLWVPDIRTDTSPRTAAASKANLGAALAVPILAREEVVAVLEFFLEEPRTEDQRLTQLVSAVAAQLGAVVQKKRAEEALRAKSDELARINDELEQFVYFASHDLREPLHVVLGYLQRLERRYRTGEDEFDPMWDYAVKGAVQMQELIKDLLGYARLGKVPLSLESVDLGGLLDQVLSTLKWDLDEVKATVTRGRLPTVEADKRQILQVLQNLVSNAVKFRKKRVLPKIRVSAVREEDTWHVSVKDNGIGIAKADQGRIFVIFQRLHTQEEYPGTGIGLSICKKIIENHGGRIWVESEAGVGSTFHFTLPAKRRAP